MAVTLPQGEDLNEWIACNIADFYKQTLMLYGSVLPLCTANTCPVMSATSKYIYKWQENNETSIQLSAPEYVDRLMTWINSLLEDETIFPSKIGVQFPPNFRDIAHRIMRRLFRIYAHIYCRHLQDVRSMDMEPHLNTSFKHFIFFAQEFQILPQSEMEPLQPCIDVLTRK